MVVVNRRRCSEQRERHHARAEAVPEPRGEHPCGQDHEREAEQDADAGRGSDACGDEGPLTLALATPFELALHREQQRGSGRGDAGDQREQP